MAFSNQNMTYANDELKFLFYVINLNLNSHILLTTTVLDSANREFTKSVKKSNNPSKLMDKER